MKTMWLILIIGMTIMSCKKEGLETNPEESKASVESYFPLSIGNYWIYENYQINEDEFGERKVPQKDSIVITGDSLIQGNQYFVIEGTNYPITQDKWGVVAIVRDSSGYLVNEKGSILLAAENFKDTLYKQSEILGEDFGYSLNYKMEPVYDLTKIISWGEQAMNYKGTLTLSKDISGLDNPRYLNNYYVKNVGRVLQTFYYLSSPVRMEKRLVQYYIN